MNHYIYMEMETTAKLIYFPAKGGSSNNFSLRGILYHVKLNYKKCSVPLHSYVLTHDEPTHTNTVCDVHWIVFYYALFTLSKVDMSVIIFPLARSLHEFTSPLFPQPPL